MKSKYIVYPQAKTVAVLEEDIAPPAPGEILCQAEKSLISIGTELHALRGEFDAGTNWADWVKYPFRPGYSMVARVIALGEGVTGIQVGDRVSTYGVHQQYFCAPWGKTRDELPEGTGAYLLPGDISSEDATWRGLAVTCQNAVRRAQFEFGEMVAVVGLGMLGQLTTRYLAAAGARVIIAIDPIKERLDLAQQGGATHTLQVSVSEAVEAIRDITRGWMLDVVFDVTGHPSTLAPCIPIVRKLGRLVLLGDTPVPTRQALGPGVVSNSVAILGIHGYMIPDKASHFAPWSALRMSDLFFDYLRAHRMSVRELVSGRYSPLQAPDVYADLLARRLPGVGMIFDWSLLG